MKNNKLFPFFITSVIANVVLGAIFISPQIVKFKASRINSSATPAVSATPQ